MVPGIKPGSSGVKVQCLPVDLFPQPHRQNLKCVLSGGHGLCFTRNNIACVLGIIDEASSLASAIPHTTNREVRGKEENERRADSLSPTGQQIDLFLLTVWYLGFLLLSPWLLLNF